jgi:hypothetical protein
MILKLMLAFQKIEGELLFKLNRQTDLYAYQVSQGTYLDAPYQA